MSKTHCPQKHEYTAENTYVTPQGARQCKTCRRDRMRDRRDGKQVGYANAKKTHCPQHHPYDEENTVFTKDGRRQCRKCARANGAIQNLKRYGMDAGKIRAMLEAQKFLCLCCDRSLMEFTPHIDHDHTCCGHG